jgi:HK97 gp10 family phage protein
MSNKKLQAQLTALQRTDYNDCVPVGVAIIIKEARRIVPVDTGFLRDHIEMRKSKDETTILVDAPYAGDVEFGTSKMEAQPYLRPAIDTKSKEAELAIAKEVDKKIRATVERNA